MNINSKVKIAFATLCAVMLLICSSCSDKRLTNSSSSEQSGDLFNSAGSTQMTITGQPTSSDSSADLNTLDNTCVGWGPGSEKNHARPSSAVSYNQKYKAYNAVFIGEDTKKVYLTFDEGYENGYTAPILDTLRDKKVKAVFFVTYDYVKRNPELVRRMIDEGHTLGNHSWSHPSIPSCSIEEAREEIMKLHNLVKEEFNYEMRLFRFPMGEFSEKMLAVCKQCGYQSVFWSFAYVDWNVDNQPDEKAALQKIENGTHNGAVYLLHAVSKTNNNILARAIENVKKQGYTWSEYDL